MLSIAGVGLSTALLTRTVKKDHPNVSHYQTCWVPLIQLKPYVWCHILFKSWDNRNTKRWESLTLRINYNCYFLLFQFARATLASQRVWSQSSRIFPPWWTWTTSCANRWLPCAPSCLRAPTPIQTSPWNLYSPQTHCKTVSTWNAEVIVWILKEFLKTHRSIVLARSSTFV